MYCILIPENVWRPNLIFLKNLCRVHKKTHSELNFCRVPVICRGLCLEAHGKMCVCRVPDLCREPFLLAHGKPSLCRVPDVLPTANFVAHGKRTFSGSGTEVAMHVYWQLEHMFFSLCWPNSYTCSSHCAGPILLG